MSCFDLIIQSGRIIDPVNKTDFNGSIAIKDGKIVEVGEELKNYNAKKIVNVSGNYIIPGIIDSHCHLAYPLAKGAGYNMLVKSGVTTAIDFEGPLDVITDEINSFGCGLNVGVLEAINTSKNNSLKNIKYSLLENTVVNNLEYGAIGVKILGGHFPLTPQTTSDVIEITNKYLGYVGFHVGTTATGSNIRGLEEAVILARDNPLHIAHINAYCRGLIDHPYIELKHSVEILKKSSNIVSESHLAPFNVCEAGIGKNGLPKSVILRNCLEMAGYEKGEKGLKQALKNSYAGIHILSEQEMKIVSGKQAVDFWEENKGKDHIMVSFPVNSRLAALSCAVEKNDKGNYVIDAISSDGGALPRNFILSYGKALIDFGALTIKDLIIKTSCAPAKMFGLVNKGHFSIGADADIIIIDPQTYKVNKTIIDGNVCMEADCAIKKPGKILTTKQGEKNIKIKGVSYEVIDLKRSTYYSKTRRV